MGKVRREVECSNDGPPLIEEQCFLCRIKDAARRYVALVSCHWAVGNRCHWVLDVIFDKDHSQVCDRAVAHKCSILSELVLKTLRDHPGKLSLRRKLKRASLAPASAFKSSPPFMRKPCSPDTPGEKLLAKVVIHGNIAALQYPIENNTPDKLSGTPPINTP